MKIGIVAISVLVLAQACARGEKASSAPSPQPSASENEMSPEFQEMGHRALDAACTDVAKRCPGVSSQSPDAVSCLLHILTFHS